VELEHFLRARPHADTEHARFGVVPEAVCAAGSTRLHAALRRGQFSSPTVEQLMGWEPNGMASRSLVRVFVDGQPRVIEADEEVQQALNAAEAGEALDASDPLVASLFESSFLVWLPKVRGD